MARLRIVRLPAGLPDGWDLADELPLGLTDADLKEMLASAPDRGETRHHGDDWPALVPIATTLPRVEPFAPELLPPALRGYVLDVAERQQAPIDFAAVAAVCGLAAVLGNKVRIRPKQHDDWRVVANQWGALIGRPSAMKTPAMQAALAPVYALQDKLGDAWKTACADAAVDGALSSLAAKDAKKKAEKLFRNGDRDGAKQLLASAKPEDAD